MSAVELNLQERERLAVIVMGILDDWELENEIKLKLLGLENTAKGRSLTRFRNGTALPEDEGLIERAKSLIGIQQSLHMVFPLNHNMPAFWLRNRNKQLKGIPLLIMLEEGVNGMDRVWRLLDCTKNW